MKIKLFTTEDGIDIFNGDKYYTLNINNSIIDDKFLSMFSEKQRKIILKKYHNKVIPKNRIAGPYINPKATEQTDDIKYFSTKEAAEEFINKNK